MHGALQRVRSRPMATLGKTSEFVHQGLGTLRISRLFGLADLPDELLHATDPFEFLGQVMPFLSQPVLKLASLLKGANALRESLGLCLQPSGNVRKVSLFGLLGKRFQVANACPGLGRGSAVRMVAARRAVVELRGCLRALIGAPMSVCVRRLWPLNGCRGLGSCFLLMLSLSGSPDTVFTRGPGRTVVVG